MATGPQDRASAAPVALRALARGEATDVHALIDGLELGAQADAERTGRPYTLANMVSTDDGRATLGGVSGRIGDEADKQLFHGLRTVVDAVMVGAGTLRTERYRRLVRDGPGLAQRRRRGLAEQPLACVVSGRLELDERVPLLADPESRVAILTASQASLPAGCRAQIEYLRHARDGRLDLTGALTELGSRLGVRTLLCEGGPHLNANLLAAGLIDELFLSLAPKLAGGDAAGESLRILAGVELEPPVAMELVSAYEHDSQLLLRYRIKSS